MKQDFIVWRKNMEFDIEVIDLQHQKLVSLVNELYSSYMQKTHEDVVFEIIKELKDYTVYHFQTEEAYFEQVNYPFTNEHKAIHRGFIKDIDELVENYKKQEGILSLKLLMYLQKWILQHIKQEVRKYVEYLK